MLVEEKLTARLNHLLNQPSDGVLWVGNGAEREYRNEGVNFLRSADGTVDLLDVLCAAGKDLKLALALVESGADSIFSNLGMHARVRLEGDVLGDEVALKVEDGVAVAGAYVENDAGCVWSDKRFLDGVADLIYPYGESEPDEGEEESGEFNRVEEDGGMTQEMAECWEQRECGRQPELPDRRSGAGEPHRHSWRRG